MERRAGTVADGFEPGAVIGALIDVKAVEKVKAHIADAVKKAPRSSPAVLTDGTTDMVITKVESFGPVAPLDRFKTDAEAIRWPTAPPPCLRRSRGRVRGGGRKVMVWR